MLKIFNLIIKASLKWSKFHQNILYKKYKSYDSVNKKIKDIKKIINIFDRWHFATKDIEWKKQTWKELWDVVTSEYYTIRKKHGDCNCFAYLALKMLEDSFYYYNQKYNQIGMIYILDRKNGHTISVWQNQNDEDDFIFTSNDRIKKCTLDELNTYINKKDYSDYVFLVSENLNLINSMKWQGNIKDLFKDVK